jgi:hypothetical protein
MAERAVDPKKLRLVKDTLRRLEPQAGGCYPNPVPTVPTNTTSTSDP